MLDGSVECVCFRPATGWTVEGWACDAADPSRPLVVEVSDGRGRVSRGLTSNQLPDPTRCGRLGFALPMPLGWRPNDEAATTYTLTIRGADGGAERSSSVRPNPVSGWLDGRIGAVVNGWALNAFDFRQSLALDFYIDGALVDRIDADRQRDDLKPYGVGDHGFQWIVPEAFLDGRRRFLTVVSANGSDPVPGPAVPIDLERRCLTGEARRLYSLRREALAKAGGLSMPAPIEDPSSILRRVLSATGAALDRFAGAPTHICKALAESEYACPPTGGAATASGLQGGLVAVSGGVVHGWTLRQPGEPPPLVDMIVDGHAAGRVVANRAARYANISGRVDFAWVVPEEYFDNHPHSIAARLANAAIPLPEGIAGLVFQEEKRPLAVRRYDAVRKAGLIELRWIDEALISEATRTVETGTLVRRLPGSATSLFDDTLADEVNPSIIVPAIASFTPRADVPPGAHRRRAARPVLSDAWRRFTRPKQRVLTALYDLAISPLTFDFAYAVAQAEVMRRAGGFARLRIYIRGNLSGGGHDAYSIGEYGWRLRHVLAPLTRLLPSPTGLEIGVNPLPSSTLFSRSHGLHWLSDLVLLAEAGHDVRVLTARPEDKAAMRGRLEGMARGRRIVTVTLRETNYGISRNSNLAAWASLCRRIPREHYAVVILRDHECVGRPLPGEWGEVSTVPESVWSVGLRMALYEAAWLNLGVNNGPMALLMLNRSTRFVIFKMLGDTPETSPQHFRRLGVAPGATFPLLGPAQRVVWEQDDIEVLLQVVLPILENETFPAELPIPSAAGQLIEAARRDYRSGHRAADHIKRVGPGPARTAVAIEWAAMLLDEGRPVDAARALGEAEASEHRDALSATIAAAAPTPEVRTMLLSSRGEADRMSSDGARSAPRETPLHVGDGAVGQSPFVVRMDARVPPEEILLRLAAAELRSRTNTAGGSVRVVADEDVDQVLQAAALFPSATLFARLTPEASEPAGPVQPREGDYSGLIGVPVRATHLFDRWRIANGLSLKGYVVSAGQPTGASDPGLGPTLEWERYVGVWPIELLAALIDGASDLILADPLAIRLAQLLGLSWRGSAGAPPNRSDSSQRSVARRLHRRGVTTANPLEAIMAHAHAVDLAPDIPAYRFAFATAVRALDPAFPDDADESADTRIVLNCLATVLEAGGRAAVAAEPTASAIVLHSRAVREGLFAAAHASGENTFARLTAPSLTDGSRAALLSALLRGVRIQEADLLTIIESVRQSIGFALLSGALPAGSVPTILMAIATQVWIRDGQLMDYGDPALRQAFRATAGGAQLDIASMLFPRDRRSAVNGASRRGL